MGTDRINLGLHANTDLGVGLYVSKPGSNVMHPEFAVSGNLMFDSNEPLSTLNVIQSGNFKITCDRIGLSSIGKFDSDGRPLGSYWNPWQQYLGYVAENSKAKLTNYMDTGMASIPIATPLINGEIPEIALRFAVGNSSGHFHPWYANVSMNEHDSKNWDEFTYNDSSEIVHMDSPWVRMKWGGIGNEAYTGMHMTHNATKLLDSLETFSVGFSINTTEQTVGTFPAEIVHPDGIAGKFYVQEAQPSSPGKNDIWTTSASGANYQIYYGGAWRDSDTGLPDFNDPEAIGPYAYYGIAVTSLLSQREALIQAMGIANPITNDDIRAEIKKQEDSMKIFSTGMGNMQGLVGLIHYANSTHLTVNAFMTPTHSGLRDYSHNAIDDYGNWHYPIAEHVNHPDTNAPFLYPLDPTNIGAEQAGSTKPEGESIWRAWYWPNKPIYQDDNGVTVDGQLYRRGGWSPRPGYRPGDNMNRGDIYIGGNRYQITLAYDVQHNYADFSSSYDSVPDDTYEDYSFYTAGARGYYEFPHVAFKHLPMVETFQSYGNRAWHHYDSLPAWNYIPGSGPNVFNSDYWPMFHGQSPGAECHPARGYDLLQRDHAKEDIYGWKGHPTQFFVNPFSNNMCTFTSHMAPGDTTTFPFSQAGSWAPKYTNPDYTGSMGLGGAGSKTAMKTDDCWDTFYCSYAVYSVGQAPEFIDAQTPKLITLDVRTLDDGGDLQNDSKYSDEPGGSDERYYNIVFPDDFVGTIGSAATDPFHDHREPITNKIYGNVNIIFKIPFLNASGIDDDYVHVGSNSFEYEPWFVGLAGPYAGYSGRPAPAITFDLSSSKFIFDNNRNISLTVENSGFVLGGGGSGGRGSRLNPEAGKAVDVATEGARGGGGGGAGGGSGGFNNINHWNAVTNPGTSLDISSQFGSYPGVGKGGYGFGRGEGWEFFVDTYPDLFIDNWPASNWQGESGIDIPYTYAVPAPGGETTQNPYYGYNFVWGGSTGAYGAGGLGSEDISIGITQDLFLPYPYDPMVGGDGGDAIYIIHDDDVLPTVEIINKLRTSGGVNGDGSVDSHKVNWENIAAWPGGAVPGGTEDILIYNALFASGGGGGGGGEGAVGRSRLFSKGGPGAFPGWNADGGFGEPGNSSNPSPYTTYYEGGNAGYLVGSSKGGAYPGVVRITNEGSSADGESVPINGRHPTDEPVKQPSGSIGFTVPAGETKEYK